MSDCDKEDGKLQSKLDRPPCPFFILFAINLCICLHRLNASSYHCFVSQHFDNLGNFYLLITDMLTFMYRCHCQMHKYFANIVLLYLGKKYFNQL
ncbi:hypothetical protein BLOT_007055 [Blomia tropicalis]|nr:hypothetical protein BLOT_007055 [Blomia tropicalis]